MATFTITDDNNITVFATAAEAAQADDSTATSFDSQAALTKVSADWPLSRFVDLWNSIPGNAEVKKFTDRKKAVARIWTAIQPLASSAQPNEPEASPTSQPEARSPPEPLNPRRKPRVLRRPRRPRRAATRASVRTRRLK